MRKLIETLWKEESGQDLMEYALLLVLVALAAIGSLARWQVRSTTCLSQQGILPPKTAPGLIAL